MPRSDQIPFRYRAVDSMTGVTRDTARRLGEVLGVDETAVIHMALHDLAVRLLPQYEPDDGPLTAGQVRQIRKLVPDRGERVIINPLFPPLAARKPAAS